LFKHQAPPNVGYSGSLLSVAATKTAK